MRKNWKLLGYQYQTLCLCMAKWHYSIECGTHLMSISNVSVSVKFTRHKGFTSNWTVAKMFHWSLEITPMIWMTQQKVWRYTLYNSGLWSKAVWYMRTDVSKDQNASSLLLLLLLLVLLFHWHYSPLWALACRTMSFHFSLSATNSLHLLTRSTLRSLSTSSFHLFLGLPLLLVPSSSWVKFFLRILSSSILSRWHNQGILYPFIHFTIFSPLLISSSSRFFRPFLSPFSYLEPCILLNTFLSKIIKTLHLQEIKETMRAKCPSITYHNIRSHNTEG